MPEQTQAIDVSWHGVVVEVPLHHRLEPLSGLRHRIMHTPAKLLLYFFELLSAALADRRAPHCEIAFRVIPADMRETKKVK